jgi:hypothetical protein
MDMCW